MIGADRDASVDELAEVLGVEVTRRDLRQCALGLERRQACAAACTKRASPKSHQWNWTISGVAPSARRDAALIARALAIDASCVTYFVYTTGARPRSRSMPISVSDRP